MLRPSERSLTVKKGVGGDLGNTGDMADIFGMGGTKDHSQSEGGSGSNSSSLRSIWVISINATYDDANSYDPYGLRSFAHKGLHINGTRESRADRHLRMDGVVGRSWMLLVMVQQVGLPQGDQFVMMLAHALQYDYATRPKSGITNLPGVMSMSPGSVVVCVFFLKWNVKNVSLKKKCQERVTCRCFVMYLVFFLNAKS